MTLQAAPHPMSVMRYLKQAWRDYIATGNAQTLVVNAMGAQVAANPITAAGTVTVDASIPWPVPVTVSLNQNAIAKGTQVATADQVTGAWTTTFPGLVVNAGTVGFISALTPYGPIVNGATFSVT